MKCINGVVEVSGNSIPRCTYECAIKHGCTVITDIPQIKSLHLSLWSEPYFCRRKCLIEHRKRSDKK